MNKNGVKTCIFMAPYVTLFENCILWRWHDTKLQQKGKLRVSLLIISKRVWTMNMFVVVIGTFRWYKILLWFWSSSDVHAWIRLSAVTYLTATDSKWGRRKGKHFRFSQNLNSQKNWRHLVDSVISRRRSGIRDFPGSRHLENCLQKKVFKWAPVPNFYDIWFLLPIFSIFLYSKFSFL